MGGLLRHALPEPSERISRLVTPATRQTVREHDGVDRTGAGRGGAFKRQSTIFQQAIEHAPGKGAVAAATLKTQINRFGLDLRRLGFGRLNSLVHKIAFLNRSGRTGPCSNTEAAL
jgi:hypothetical protein